MAAYIDVVLDVSRLNNSLKIIAKQNDVDSRYLRIKFVNNGNGVDVSGYSSAQINIKRADGQTEAFSGEIAEGVVTAPIPSWALEVSGYADGDISLLNGEGAILSTTSFRLFVERSNYKREITEDSPNYTAFEQALIDIEALKSGGSSGGGEDFRKIGFTSDCDFVATESDGLTAFRGALNAAADGETILVMPGVYKGTERFDVTKNIVFVGIGKPVINFPIWISGGGVFSYENWEWTELYRNVRGTWQGFVFRGNVSVGMEANPDTDAYAGEGVFTDCDFICLSVLMCGSAKNCTFDVTYFTSGHYYGVGECCTEFDGCTIKTSGSFDASSAYDKFVRCDIYPTSGETYITTEWGDYKTFVGCKMYALGTSLSLSDNHSSVTNLNDTIVFANSVSGTRGGYLVTPTVL